MQVEARDRSTRDGSGAPGPEFPLDEAVRSIRVATALAERFGAILSSRSSMSVDELELLIGESQQLYPEIWRHLDDARRVLVRHGRDVRLYDELRRTELVHLGVTDIQVTDQIDYVALAFGRYARTVSKTATFNVEGFERAVAACHALGTAMPEVDWVGLARRERHEIAAAGSLSARKWRGVAMGIGVLVVLAVVGTILYRFRPREDDLVASADTHARRSLVPDGADLAALAMQHRDARIRELRAAYDATCDREHLPELVQLMRDNLRASEAAALERGRCVPVRPSCDAVRDAIAARLATEHALVRDAAWQLRCTGVFVADDAASMAPGFAVVVTARAGRGKPRTWRGVVSLDGARDVVAFAPSPVPTLVGVADLDEDGDDELVMIDRTRLVVTRVERGGFVDIAGPSLSPACQASVNVERDLRPGRGGDHRRVVITVDDPASRAGCPAPGRHYHALVGDRLEPRD